MRFRLTGIVELETLGVSQTEAVRVFEHGRSQFDRPARAAGREAGRSIELTRARNSLVSAAKGLPAAS